MILASRERHRRWPRRVSLALCLLAAPAFAPAAPPPDPGAPLPYVIGLHEAYLTPQYWAARLDNADAPILTARRSRRRTRGCGRRTATSRTSRRCRRSLMRRRCVPASPRCRAGPHAPSTAASQPIAPALRSAIEANLGLDAIPAEVAPAYGLVVKRAALRTFPTRERVFSSVDDTDIDRFQESALFPGDKVAVVHRSADGRWLFVHSERYSAWIEAEAIASGDKATAPVTARRARTGSSPVPPRRPPTPRKSRVSRACSWTWACACRCWPTGRLPIR